MHRAWSRVREEGDTRPTAKIPFKPVGWYCQKCGALQSGDWLIQSSSWFSDIKGNERIICLS